MKLDRIIHEKYGQHFLDLDSRALSQGKTKEIIPHLKTTLIDPTSLQLMQIPDLFDAVNYTETNTGSAVLLRSLAQPLNDLRLIKEKQESVREIEKDGKLRGKLQELLSSLKEGEDDFYKYLFEDFSVDSQYKVYKKARFFLTDFVNKFKDLPVKTSYLEVLVKDIQNTEKDRIFDFVNGPVYRTFKGLKPRKGISFFTPGIRFTYRPSKLASSIPLLSMYLAGGLELLGPIILIGVISYGFIMHYDAKHFIGPLKKVYKSDACLRTSLEALGKIDEVLSFYNYAKAMGCEMTLPEVTDSDKHYMIIKNARNPIDSKGNPNFVPNDINLKDIYLTLITGPNSGGKTTICKTIVQIQDLAQIGCYVPGRVELSLTDKIHYQAPMFDSLMDKEGRFGTELLRTKEAFYGSTSKSLIVLDEIAQGTTFDEELKHSYEILDDFYAKKNNILVVTHNHNMVDLFKRDGKGQYLMAEFKNDNPAFKLVPGISRVSHAGRVAKKIGFSKEDRRKHLIEEGYISK